MKKIIFILLLIPLLLTSCGDSSSKKLEERITETLEEDFDEFYIKDITKKEFVLAKAEMYVFSYGDALLLPIKWECNSPRISLTYDNKDGFYDTIMGGEVKHTPIYRGFVNSFPINDETIQFTATVTHDRVTCKKTFNVIIKNGEISFIEENMKNWIVDSNGNLQYYIDEDADVVKPGQLYSERRQNATWDISTYIVKGHIFERQGSGGSTNTWKTCDNDFEYNINTQTLTIDGIYNVDLSHDSNKQELQKYLNMGIEMNNVISNLSKILGGINKYLDFKNRSELKCVPSATWSGDKFFGNY